MHREREDPRLVSKDRGGAVAMVHIQVNDQHPSRLAGRDQVLRRNSEVVEHAIPGGTITVSMVRAPREMPRPTMLESMPSSRNGSACTH